MPGAQCGDPRRGPGTGRSSAAPCQRDPPPHFGSGVGWFFLGGGGGRMDLFAVVQVWLQTMEPLCELKREKHSFIALLGHSGEQNYTAAKICAVK